MKLVIKEILQELTDYAETFQAKKYLLEARDNMEFSDLINLIEWLLQWQKMIIHFPEANKSYTNSEYLLNDPLKIRFKKLFEHCSALSEIFVYRGDRIEYNPKLTEKERTEILEFIDKNHTITMTKIRRK